MDLTLDQLLASLESGMTKSAAEDCEDKDDKKDDGKKELPAFMRKDGDKDDKGDKSEKSDDEDKEDKEDKSEGQEKKASDLGAALAREIMEKVASTNLDTGMNKQASTAGQALAQALLKQAQTKKASSGDMTTTDGIAPGVVPNKNQVDNAAMEAEGASYIKPMVTGDGIKNTGTVNEIFDALIADALAQGAASTDQVHTTGLSAQEGAVEDHAVPNQVKVASDLELADQIEKAAAVSELVSQGVDFDTAFELVKQAEAEIDFEMQKSAAMESLMAEGVSFEDAVAMVKEASSGDMTTSDGIAQGVVPNKNQVDNAAMEAEGAATVKPMPTGDGISNKGNVNQIFDAIIADAMSQGAASTDQVHETGVAKAEGAVEDHAVPNQVKVAAMNELLEAGVDFDEAAEFVKEAGAAGMLAGTGKLSMKARAHGAMLGTKARLKDLAGGASSLADKAKSSVTGAGNRAYTDAKLLASGETGGHTVSVNSKGRASSPRLGALGRLASNGAVQGSAGVGALAGAGGTYALSREKKANAMNELMDAGIDFDLASEIVKEASATTMFLSGPGKLSTTAKAQAALLGGKARLKDLAGDASSMFNKAKSGVSGAASRAKTDAKLLASGETGGHTISVNSKGSASSPRLGAAGRLSSNGAVQGAIGAGALTGAGGYALGREKKAAVDSLMEAGVDFDSAVTLVNDKAQELYGE